MLSFATEFPVGADSDVLAFIRSIRTWLSGSPHSRFVEQDLVDIPPDGEWSLSKESERFDYLGLTIDDRQMAGARYVNPDGDIEWVTEATFCADGEEGWVSVRTSRESAHPVFQLPPAKKPILVGRLLEDLGGAVDGELFVQDEPHRLGNDDIDLATRLIQGDAGCHLPVVYISCGFNGQYVLDAGRLASDISGMAHVVVEPNRPFSQRLQINVRAENVYGGVVGIYWPDSATRRSFFLPRDYTNSSQLKKAILDEVRLSLLNRRPLQNNSWVAVQGAVSQKNLAELHASGSNEVEKYVRAFDGEMRAKDERLAQAEREISRLKMELRTGGVQLAPGSGVVIKTGSERDLFRGEIADVVFDALADATLRVAEDGRRHHVLSAILMSNEKLDGAQFLKDKIKTALRQYRSLDKATRASLEDAGFSISEDGKHYKLVYRGDPRYTFSLSKTSSDGRGGLNLSSDISKRIF